MPHADIAAADGTAWEGAAPWELCIVGVGSNLGDRAVLVQGAVDGLRRTPGIEVVACSRVIETEPVGPAPQPRYLNAVIKVRTRLSPGALLAVLHELEHAAGRRRAGERRWGPRTLDLDLLLFGGRIVREAGLEVPHPRLHERRFVLEPLVDIDPDVVHPVLGLSARDLLAALDATGASASAAI